MSDSFFIEFRFHYKSYIVEVMERNGKPFYSTFIEDFGKISKPVESDSILVRDRQGRDYNIELELYLDEYSEYNKVKAYYTNLEREKVYIEYVKYSSYNPLGYNFKHQYLIKDYLLRLLKSSKMNLDSGNLYVRSNYKYPDNEIEKIQDQLSQVEQLYQEIYLPSYQVDSRKDHSHIFQDIYCKIDLEEIEYYSLEEDLSSAFIQRLSKASTYLRIAKLTPICDYEIPNTEFYKLQGLVSSHSLREYQIGYIRSSFWINEKEIIFNFNCEELDVVINKIEKEESRETNFNSCQPLKWCIDRMEAKEFQGDLNHNMSEEIEGWLEDNSFDNYGFDYIHKRLDVYHEKNDHRKLFVFPDVYVTIDYGYDKNINYIKKVPRKSFFDLKLPNFKED